MSELTILHFNDVYEIGEKPEELCGGPVRFASLVKKYDDPILLFSGDALNPSYVSTFTNGMHMVEVLNNLKVDCACVGNHDFDFGVDNLEDAQEASNFPWLLSNVTDDFTDRPLANANITHVVERSGIRVGLIGLVELEWMVALSTVDEEDVTVEDFMDVGATLAQELKSKGCDIVVAITHMRWPNNEKVAWIDGVDLVLGGHDHFFKVDKVNGKFVAVSGCDFLYLSEFHLTFDGQKKLTDVSHTKHDVMRKIPRDNDMLCIVEKYTAQLDKMLDKPIGFTETDLDGRFETVRGGESNLGNLVCDIICAAMSADCSLINGGLLRSNMIHNAGMFKMRDLVLILPYQTPMVVIRVNGSTIMEALENGVSQYPKQEGRFPQVGNIVFNFDPHGLPGKRVYRDNVLVDDQLLDMNKFYHFALPGFLYQGKDGYTMFKGAEVLVDEHDGVILPTLVKNYFICTQIAKGLRQSRSLHHQAFISKRSQPVRHAIEKFRQLVVTKTKNRKNSLKKNDQLKQLEDEMQVSSVAPTLQRRISSDPAHVLD